jgi:hypothetical protein
MRLYTLAKPRQSPSSKKLRSSRPPEFPLDFKNKIVCGDALDLMCVMPDESVDLVITSPPYNLKNSTGNGMKDGRGGKWERAALKNGYSHHADCMPHEQYVAWQRACLSEMMRLIPEDGAIFCNHKWRVQNGFLQDRSDIVAGWQGLVAAIDRPELASDPRFATRMQRVHNQIALQDTLRPIFRLRSRVEWIEPLERTDVPYAPIFRLSETLVDEQVRHLGIERQVLHPTEGLVRTIRRPMVYDHDRAGIEIDPAPLLNEHGAAIRAAYAAEPSRPRSVWKERVSASDAACK